MNRKNFIIASLGALCAAAVGRASPFAASLSPAVGPVKKNGGDKMTLISCSNDIGYDGKKTIGWGWMFHDKSPKNGDYLERTAIILEPENETRDSIVRKLRMLANSIETGKDAVIGENNLRGQELCALDYEDRSPYANLKADQKLYANTSEEQRKWYPCFYDKIINAAPEDIAKDRAACNAIRMAKRLAKGLV